MKSICKRRKQATLAIACFLSQLVSPATRGQARLRVYIRSIALAMISCKKMRKICNCVLIVDVSEFLTPSLC